jgi:hypothetical protein
VTNIVDGELVRALDFYPDNRTYGLKGGWGTSTATRQLRP